jgi:hypothetical protein
MTPIMKRTQTLATSSEICFVDSTASVTRDDISLTTLLVSTKAGGLPIAMFLHEKQSTEGYVNAFRLLEGFTCFGGQNVCIMNVLNMSCLSIANHLYLYQYT